MLGGGGGTNIFGFSNVFPHLPRCVNKHYVLQNNSIWCYLVCMLLKLGSFDLQADPLLSIHVIYNIVHNYF